MFKLIGTSFALLILVTPGLAKSTELYPVSCNDLWVSVKTTLDNSQNYGITSVDDLNLRASFVVVGNLTQYTDKVSLTARNGNCELKSAFLEVGSDNTDWRQFHHRLAKSLAKWLASKPSSAPKGAAQP